MPTLSIVIPAHNEEAVVESTVNEVHTVVHQLGLDAEIILVNDGSTDRTGEIGRALARRIPSFQLVEHYPSRHYGGALKAGFATASREVIAFFPADRQFVFGKIDRLLAKLADADIVSGYRAHRQDNWTRRFNGLGWNLLIRHLEGWLCLNPLPACSRVIGMSCCSNRGCQNRDGRCEC